MSRSSSPSPRAKLFKKALFSSIIFLSQLSEPLLSGISGTFGNPHRRRNVDQ